MFVFCPLFSLACTLVDYQYLLPWYFSRCPLFFLFMFLFWFIFNFLLCECEVCECSFVTSVHHVIGHVHVNKMNECLMLLYLVWELILLNTDRQLAYLMLLN